MKTTMKLILVGFVLLIVLLSNNVLNNNAVSSSFNLQNQSEKSKHKNIPSEAIFFANGNNALNGLIYALNNPDIYYDFNSVFAGAWLDKERKPHLGLTYINDKARELAKKFEVELHLHRYSEEFLIKSMNEFHYSSELVEKYFLNQSIHAVAYNTRQNRLDIEISSVGLRNFRTDLEVNGVRELCVIPAHFKFLEVEGDGYKFYIDTHDSDD